MVEPRRRVDVAEAQRGDAAVDRWGDEEHGGQRAQGGGVGEAWCDGRWGWRVYTGVKGVKGVKGEGL